MASWDFLLFACREPIWFFNFNGYDQRGPLSKYSADVPDPSRKSHGQEGIGTMSDVPGLPKDCNGWLVTKKLSNYERKGDRELKDTFITQET